MVFAMANLSPGDPLLQMMDVDMSPGVTPEVLEQKRTELGLDKPMPVRYLIWLKEALTGNLGYSFNTRRPVVESIVEKLPNTLKLMGSAFILSILIGVPVGIISAMRQYSFLDYLVTSFSFFMMAMPVFFFAMLAIYLFAINLGIFPSGGVSTLWKKSSCLDQLWHLALPALMLGLKNAAIWVRYTRSSMLEVVNQDYITTVRSKGFVERYILYQHAMPNAVGPLITIFGLMLPTLIAGAVITESVFAWPGIGKLAVEAIGDRDYPILMGITLLIAMVVLISNLTADILYGVADPRIRYEK